MNAREIGYALKRERWILNAHSVLPSDLQAHLEKQRDHYAATSLVAGVDPRDGTTKLLHVGAEHFVDHMTRGIKAVMAMVDGETRPMHVTLFGLLRNETEERPGDELNISVSVAQKLSE